MTGPKADRRFLVLRRAVDEEYPGVWQGVAGGIETSETAWEAALRETREETGVTPVELYALDHVSTFYVHRLDAIVRMPAFLAVLPSVNIELSPEHDAFQWLSHEAAVARLSWKPAREALRSIPDLLARPEARALCRIDIDHLKNTTK